MGDLVSWLLGWRVGGWMESLSCGGGGWFDQWVTWLADGWVGGLVGGWKVLSCGGWGGWLEHWVTWLADCWVVR